MEITYQLLANGNLLSSHQSGSDAAQALKNAKWLTKNETRSSLEISRPATRTNYEIRKVIKQ